jgi:hypothetical protein
MEKGGVADTGRPPVAAAAAGDHPDDVAMLRARVTVYQEMMQLQMQPRLPAPMVPPPIQAAVSPTPPVPPPQYSPRPKSIRRCADVIDCATCFSWTCNNGCDLCKLGVFLAIAYAVISVLFGHMDSYIINLGAPKPLV